MYEIFLQPSAEKFLKKLEKKEKNILLNKLENLKINPFLGKPLTGNLSGLFSLRADKYRIIYKKITEKLIILVVDIGHRKNIYKN